MIITLLVMLLGMTEKIYAHLVELDPDSLISFPFMVINGKGELSISSKVSNYTLYYQWVDLSTSIYNQIKTLKSERDSYYNTQNQVLDTKKANINNLKQDYEDKKAKDPNSAETVTALTTYNN